MKRLLLIPAAAILVICVAWVLYPRSLPPRLNAFLTRVFGDEVLPITTEVQVISEKMVYEVGEVVLITVQNTTDEEIRSHVGSMTPVFAIEYVERLMPDSSWRELHAFCEYPHCTYEKHATVAINAGESQTFKWRPVIYVDGTAEEYLAGPGLYRLTIRYQVRKSLGGEALEWRASRSNEFRIE